MGTNFYVTPDPACVTCGRRDGPIHIGKSSGGWVFGLRVYEESGLTEWPAWEAWLTERADRIVDEGGRPVSLEDLKRRIVDRHRPELLKRALGSSPERPVAPGEHGTYEMIGYPFS